MKKILSYKKTAKVQSWNVQNLINFYSKSNHKCNISTRPDVDITLSYFWLAQIVYNLLHIFLYYLSNPYFIGRKRKEMGKPYPYIRIPNSLLLKKLIYYSNSNLSIGSFNSSLPIFFLIFFLLSFSFCSLYERITLAGNLQYLRFDPYDFHPNSGESI